ncbi:AAA family ATPase [Candidatus Parcubacteria bacterium]|nr:AAA family ATPase [Candidatus Parcubacteria bacterium]
MPKKKIIIGLVGEISSGKGAINKYLEKNYHAKTFRFSTILRDVLDRIYFSNSRQNIQLLSTILRQNFGENVLSKVMAKDVENAKKNIISIDGIRRQADIECLKKIKGFILIQVQAGPKTRYERLIARNENKGDTNKSYEEFLADSKKEADADIPKVMKTADYAIDNNGTLKNLHDQIDKLIKNIK